MRLGYLLEENTEDTPSSKEEEKPSSGIRYVNGSKTIPADEVDEIACIMITHPDFQREITMILRKKSSDLAKAISVIRQFLHLGNSPVQLNGAEKIVISEERLQSIRQEIIKIVSE